MFDRIAVGVMVLSCLSWLGRVDPAAGQDLPPAERCSLGEMLYRTGIQFDCYFTVEAATVPDRLENLLDRDLGAPPEPEDLDDVIDFLARNQKDLQVLVDERNRKVIHVIQRGCIGLKDYPLEKTLTDFTFEGRVGDLLDLLRNEVKGLEKQTFFAVPGLGPDCTTRVSVRAFKGPVRSLLSDALPLSQYRRVLWDSEYDPATKIAKVTFSGRTFRGSLGREDDKWRKIRLDEKGVRAFDDVRAQLVKRALEALRLGGVQLRWAILLLGDLRAEEGVKPLLDRIDWEYTRSLNLDERFPALRALTVIGTPVVKPALERLTEVKGEFRRRLLCELLRRILGRSLAREALKIALAAEKDPGKAKQFEEALAALESLPD
jgi:hypothetical protein